MPIILFGHVILGESCGLAEGCGFDPRPIQWKWCQSHARINSYTQLWQIIEKIRNYRCQFHQYFNYNFYARRSQKRNKIQLSHEYLFTHLGSTSVKAVRRTLMKLSPGNQMGQNKKMVIQFYVLQDNLFTISAFFEKYTMVRATRQRKTIQKIIIVELFYNQL